MENYKCQVFALNRKCFSKFQNSFTQYYKNMENFAKNDCFICYSKSMLRLFNTNRTGNYFWIRLCFGILTTARHHLLQL
jgi:hypothetical protein